MTDERRNAPRVPVDLMVRLDLPDGSNINAKTSDFSNTGLSIECDSSTAQILLDAAAAGKPPKLKLRWLDPMAAGPKGAQQADVTSVHAVPLGNGNYRFGLRHAASNAYASELEIPIELRDEFRRVFEQICLELTNVRAPAIVVTSTDAGEGVSTIAWWLAVSLASRSVGDVLYLNTCLQKSQTSRSQAVGLHGLANVSGQIEQACFRTENPFLYVMDAWPERNAGAVQISEQQIGSAISALQQRFAYVLIDAQPVMASPLTLAFARRSDGVLLVIQANKTDRDRVQTAAQLLGRGGAKILGAVLNKL